MDSAAANAADSAHDSPGPELDADALEAWDQALENINKAPLLHKGEAAAVALEIGRGLLADLFQRVHRLELAAGFGSGE